MTRYAFVNNEILKIFRKVDRIEFPIDVLSVISAVVPNCRCMTYQDVANVTGSSIEEVSALCESHSGCTHYDVANDRYLVMYNDSSENNNNEGTPQREPALSAKILTKNKTERISSNSSICKFILFSYLFIL